MKYCLFQWRKEIIRFYSDRISLKYLKIKLETFSFAVKLYDLKITIRKVYCSGNQEYSSHVISGSKLHAAHVVRWSETCLGLFLTDGDFTKWRQAMRTHGTQSRSMFVSFETRAFEIYATLPAGPRTLSTR